MGDSVICWFSHVFYKISYMGAYFEKIDCDGLRRGHFAMFSFVAFINIFGKFLWFSITSNLFFLAVFFYCCCYAYAFHSSSSQQPLTTTCALKIIFFVCSICCCCFFETLSIIFKDRFNLFYSYLPTADRSSFFLFFSSSLVFLFLLHSLFFSFIRGM